MCEFLSFGCSFSTSSTSNSQDGANADRILKKPRQLNSTLPLTAAAAAAAITFDNSCVAARIRPICRYKKRRLVRVSAVSHLSRKVGVTFLLCNCCRIKDFEAMFPMIKFKRQQWTFCLASQSVQWR